MQQSSLLSTSKNDLPKTYECPFNFESFRPSSLSTTTTTNKSLIKYVECLLKKLDNKNLTRFYGYTIRHRHNVNLFANKIRSFGWKLDEFSSIDFYTELLSNTDMILFEIIYEIFKLHKISTPINIDIRKRKLYYFEKLLQFLLIVMIKFDALSMHRMQLWGQIMIIYKDLIKTMKLPFEDFFIQIDQCWIDNFFEENDRNFKLRSRIDGFMISKVNEQDTLSMMLAVSSAINGIDNNKVANDDENFFSDKRQKPKKVDDCTKNYDNFIGFEFIESQNPTPIVYNYNSTIKFEDDDNCALKENRFFLRDFPKDLTRIPSFDRSIKNLIFSNDPSKCDCNRKDCDGCQTFCLNCKEKKCFGICRKDDYFNNTDVYINAQTYHKKDPYDKSINKTESDSNDQNHYTEQTQQNGATHEINQSNNTIDNVTNDILDDEDKDNGYEFISLTNGQQQPNFIDGLADINSISIMNNMYSDSPDGLENYLNFSNTRFNNCFREN